MSAAKEKKVSLATVTHFEAITGKGVLYPITGLLLNPMIAATAMVLSSVSVIINALRLRKIVL